MTLLPDFYEIDVYNLTNEDLATVKETKTISALDEVDALLCCGEIEDIYTHPEETNVITTLVIADGSAFSQMRVSKTIGSGSWNRDAFFHILGGRVNGSYLAANPRLPRGQVFLGRLDDNVHTLAKTANARAFFTHGSVYIVEKGKADDILTLEENDIIDEPSYAEGICIVKAKVHGYSVGTLMKFRGRVWRLVSQSINADNMKGAWRTELTLVDESYLSAYGMEGG